MSTIFNPLRARRSSMLHWLALQRVNTKHRKTITLFKTIQNQFRITLKYTLDFKWKGELTVAQWIYCGCRSRLLHFCLFSTNVQFSCWQLEIEPRTHISQFISPFIRPWFTNDTEGVFELHWLFFIEWMEIGIYLIKSF